MLGIIEAAHVPLAVAILPQINGSLFEDAAVCSCFLKAEHLVLGLSFQTCRFRLDGPIDNFTSVQNRHRLVVAEGEIARNAEYASDNQ